MLIDSESASGNIDPALVRQYLADAARRGALPKALIAVHLYGQHAEMDSIATACAEYGVPLVEDAAESLGATYKGRETGTTAPYALLSFNGNKIITTSGGGVLAGHDRALIDKARFWSTQSREPVAWYEHREIGFNYRMTNLAAALGVSQLKKVQSLIVAHQQVYAWYREALSDMEELAWQGGRPDTVSVQWLTSVRMTSAEHRPALRDDLMQRLRADGIDTRPFFYPMHHMPPYASNLPFPVADSIASSGLNLPSSPHLTASDVEFIAARVRAHVRDLNSRSLVAGANLMQGPVLMPPANVAAAHDGQLGVAA